MCDAVQPLGLPVALPEKWTDALGSGLLAACKRPGSGIEQAVVGREHDIFCLAVMLAPEPVAGVTWSQLDQRGRRPWQESLRRRRRGRYGRRRACG